MARKPRIHFPGAVYHATLRGNAKQDIFSDDTDRFRLYLLLHECVERFGCRIHAFCLMSNHIHLAIQVGKVPLSRIMQNLAFRYTRWVNWRQNRVGHLFQGRYKALLVDGDAYLLELVRYIHLNPARAGMVPSPEAYPWSGHRAYLGKEHLPWLTTQEVLGHFAVKEATARRRYEKFVLDALGQGKNEAFYRGEDDARILGDESFVQSVLAPTEARDQRLTVGEILEAVSEAYSLSADDLSMPGRAQRPAEARALAALAAIHSGDVSLTELASHFRRDVSTLSTTARRLRDRLLRDAEHAGPGRDVLLRLNIKL